MGRVCLTADEKHTISIKLQLKGIINYWSKLPRKHYHFLCMKTSRKIPVVFKQLLSYRCIIVAYNGIVEEIISRNNWCKKYIVAQFASITWTWHLSSCMVAYIFLLKKLISTLCDVSVSSNDNIYGIVNNISAVYEGKQSLYATIYHSSL